MIKTKNRLLLTYLYVIYVMYIHILGVLNAKSKILFFISTYFIFLEMYKILPKFSINH